MKEIIIKDMSFSYKEKKIFSNINLDIEDKAFVTILGSISSGKTTFAKILMGLLPFHGYVCLNRTILEKKNISLVHRKVSYISENFYNDFLFQSVLDELVYTVENMGYTKNEIQRLLTSITSLFHLEGELDKKISDLTLSQKAIIKLASTLISHPKILILDNLLSFMNLDDRKMALSILQKFNKEKGLIVLHITNNVEDVFYGTDILLFGEAFYSYFKTDSIFEREKDFQKAKIPFPFMVSLSKKLSYYSLVDHMILDKRKMVNALWK